MTGLPKDQESALAAWSDAVKATMHECDTFASGKCMCHRKLEPVPALKNADGFPFALFVPDHAQEVQDDLNEMLTACWHAWHRYAFPIRWICGMPGGTDGGAGD